MLRDWVVRLIDSHRVSGEGVDPIGESSRGISKRSSKMASRSSAFSTRSLLRDRGFTGVVGGEKMPRGRTGSLSRGEAIRAGFQGPFRIRGTNSVPDLVPTLDT